MATYINICEEFIEADHPAFLPIAVTPQWYAEQALALGLADPEDGSTFPTVVQTSIGLIIDGELVAGVIP